MAKELGHLAAVEGCKFESHCSPILSCDGMAVSHKSDTVRGTSRLLGNAMSALV